MQLFNLHENGAEEIVACVGAISQGITFDKWAPLIPFGTRDVIAIVGREPVEALAQYYVADERTDSQMNEALLYLQQSVAFFTWLKLIPTLDAQHDENGRSRRLGENEKGLTALQEFKDEENILKLAYEAVDAFVDVMERADFEFWRNSPKMKLRAGMLIKSKDIFDDYYVIGSHRLFVSLIPMMSEVQATVVAPALGSHFAEALVPATPEMETIADLARRVVALLTIKKAVERLPVEVLPDGIVQVNQSQTVKARQVAEKSARQSVAAALAEDARAALESLQGLVAELDSVADETDGYIGGPIVHSKGISF